MKPIERIIVGGLIAWAVMVGVTIGCQRAKAEEYVNPFEVAATVKIETADAMGSGVVVAHDLVLTAAHVVSGSSIVQVVFSDGTKARAKVVPMPGDYDVALLAVAVPSSITPVVDSCEHLQLGQPIDVFGYPLDLGLVYTPGIISSVDTINNPQTSFQVAISAAITHGNSGGPVFNKQGKLIGIVDQMVQAANGPAISFMIPMSDVDTCKDDTAKE